MGVSSGGLYDRFLLNYFDFTDNYKNRTLLHSEEWSGANQQYIPHNHTFADLMPSGDEIIVKHASGDGLNPGYYAQYDFERRTTSEADPQCIVISALTGPGFNNAPVYGENINGSGFLLLQKKGGGAPSIHYANQDQVKWTIEMWVKVAMVEGGGDDRDVTIWHGGPGATETNRLFNLKFRRGSDGYSNSYFSFHTIDAGSVAINSYDEGDEGYGNFLPHARWVHISYSYIGFNLCTICYNGRRIIEDNTTDFFGGDKRRVNASDGLFLFGHPLPDQDINVTNSYNEYSSIGLDINNRFTGQVGKIRIHNNYLSEDKIYHNYRWDYDRLFKYKDSTQPQYEGPYEDY